jgi:hypothetical protein
MTKYYNTRWKASVVIVSPVMCSGKPNTSNVNGVGISPLNLGLNLRQGMRDRYKVRISTYDDGILTGKSKELADLLK